MKEETLTKGHRITYQQLISETATNKIKQDEVIVLDESRWHICWNKKVDVQS